MRVQEMKSQMQRVQAPAQPLLRTSTACYEQKVIRINPLCEKGDGLIYQFTTGPDANAALTYVPDGCLDILFSCDMKPQAVVTSYLSQAKTWHPKPNTTYFGVKPYAGFVGTRNLKLSPTELAGQQCTLEELMPTNGLEERIAAAKTMEERATLFCAHLEEICVDEGYISSLPGYISLCLCCSGGSLKLDSLESYTGYSGRYCRKQFSEEYGLPIKEYAQLVRFQRSLRLLTDTGAHTLAEVACESGYFDEAHFINDFRTRIGTSPGRFRRDVFLQTG